MSLITTTNFTFYTYGTDITENDLIATPGDPAQEKFNKIDLALTFGLLALYKDQPSIIQHMVGKAANAQNQIFNLLTYANEKPQINAVFDSVFSSKFQDYSTYGNWKSYVQANYEYDTSYIPFVGFANLDSIDITQGTSIAAPLEIVNDQNFPDWNNIIPMWVKDGSAIKLTTIGFDLAKTMTSPILIVGNGLNGDEFRVSVKDKDFLDGWGAPSTLSCSVPTHFHESLSLIQYKINERFERDNETELRFKFSSTIAYDPSIPDWFNYYSTSGTLGYDIHKDNLYVIYTTDTALFCNHKFPDEFCLEIAGRPSGSDNRFAIGAYEFDWYVVNWKSLYKVYFENPYYHYRDFDVKRRFNSDWYFLDPNLNNSYPFAIRNPSLGSIYSNWERGEMQIKRQAH